MRSLFKYQSSDHLFPDAVFSEKAPEVIDIDDCGMVPFDIIIGEIDPSIRGNRFSYKQAIRLNECRYAGLNLIPSKTEACLLNKVIEAKKLGRTYKDASWIKGKITLQHNKNMKTPYIKKILVPTDFSETGLLAMDHAIYLARLVKAHLYIVHVIEAFEYAYSIYEPDMDVSDTVQLQGTINGKLERVATEISKEYGINVSTLLGNGRPSSGIAEAVKENEIDLVIMGTHGAHGFEEYFIGSNAHKVVTMSQCPVITIQQHATKLGFSNIVMPIDNSLHSRQKVDHVINLASIYGAKVHILGLLNSDEEIDEKRFNIKIESAENALKSAEIPYVCKIIKGANIAVEAMKYSNKVDADLIVIMTDHESNITGMFLGNLSKQIVNHSKIPVMSIKPHGFIGSGYSPFGSNA